MKKHIRILFIEDSEDDLLLIINKLKEGDFEPEWQQADTEQKVIEAVENERWDLILCDYRLPGFTGLRALEIFREKKLDTPFIFVSGTMGEDIAVDAMRHGAHDYVTKGNPARLIPAIERELREYSIRQQQKKSEELLRKLSMAVEQNPISIVITDTSGLIEYVNPKFTELTGYTLEEAIGKNPRILKSGLTPEYYYVDLWKNIKSGKIWRGEFCNKKKNGELYWEMASISPVFDETGEITHFVASKEDITQQKEIDRQLRDNEEKYRILFESISDATFLLDIQSGEVIEVNRAGCEFYGYSRDELILSKANNLIVEPEQAFINGCLKNTHSESQWHRRKDGTVFPVEVSSGMYSWNERKVCLVAVRDITERYTHQKALREKEERFRTVFEFSPLGMVMTDDKMTFISANQAFCKFTGYSERELLGMNIMDVTHPDHRTEDSFNVRKLISGEKFSYITEKKYLGKNGRIIWGKVHVAVVRSSKEGFLYSIALIEDITESKKAAENLKLKDDLIRMTGNIAHIGGWEFDAETLEETWTDEVARIYERDNTEGINVNTCFNYYSGESRKEMENAVKHAIEDAIPYEIELELNTKSGKRKFVKTVGIPVLQNEKVIKVRGIFQDITKQKEAENEIIEISRKNEDAMDFAGMAYWEFDISTTSFDFNERFCKLHQIDEADLKGGKMPLELFESKYITEEFRGQLTYIIKFAIETNDAEFQTQVEGKLIKSDSSFIWVNIWFRIIKDENKRTIKIVGVNQDITSRKMAEESLALMVERFDLAVKAAHFGVWDYDVKSNQNNWDEQMFILFGLNNVTNNLTYDEFIAFIHPDDQEYIREFTTRMLQTTGEYDYEFRIVRPDGEVRHLKAFCLVQNDSGGKPLRVTGINYDISEEKFVQEKLKINEQKFRALVEASSDIIWEVDSQGRYTYLSPIHERLTGYKQEEVLGKRPFDFQLKEESQNMSRLFMQTVEKKANIKGLENTILTKDGKQINLELNAVAFYDNNGEIAGYRGVNRDITSWKVARKALQESELKFRSLFNSMNEGVALHELVLDNEGNPVDYVIREINPAFIKHTTISAQNVMNKKATEAYDSAVAPFLEVYANVVKTRVPVTFEEFYAPLDKEFEISVFSPLPGWFATVFSDITQRKRSELAIVESREQLKKFAAHLQTIREEERLALSREIHDELGQILATFKINLGLIRNKIAKGDAEIDMEDISLKITSLFNLVDIMFKTTRKILTELRPELLDTLGIIEAIKSHAIEFQQDSNIKCYVFIPIKKLEIAPEQSLALYRIYQEAMTNILKHSSAEKVNISLTRKSNLVTLEIEDNGIGIEEDDLHKSGSFGIMGINERIELLQGKLTLKSKPEGGTVLRASFLVKPN